MYPQSNLKYYKKHETVKDPVFATNESACFDIHAHFSESITVGVTAPRVVVSDYYHEVFVMLYNASADTVRIEHGERICQGELVSSLSYSLEETPTLPERRTNRVGGFGSTGVK